MPVATFANIQRVCLCCVSALFVDIACNALFICYTYIYASSSYAMQYSTIMKNSSAWY